VLARVLAQFGFADRLANCMPETPATIDFDAEARLAERRRADRSNQGTVKAARTPKRLNVVWHDGRVVGELLHSGPILFRYVPAWLETGTTFRP